MMNDPRHGLRVARPDEHELESEAVPEGTAYLIERLEDHVNDPRSGVDATTLGQVRALAQHAREPHAPLFTSRIEQTEAYVPQSWLMVGIAAGFLLGFLAAMLAVRPV